MSPDTFHCKVLELIPTCRVRRKRTEDLIKAAEAKLEAKKNEIVKIQTAAAAQRQAQGGQQAVGA